MSTKGNLRSFRYSDEVAGILEAFQGGSLNEKFENLILHCFWERKKIDAQLAQRRKEYDELSKQVEAKRAELYEINALLAEKHRLSGALTRLACDAISFGERVSKTM